MNGDGITLVGASHPNQKRRWFRLSWWRAWLFGVRSRSVETVYIDLSKISRGGLRIKNRRRP